LPFLVGSPPPPRIVVVTVIVVVAGELPGVTLGGVNVTVVAAGAPIALNVIGLGNPPVPGLTVIVYIAGCPAGTVFGAGGVAGAKSMPVPFSVTVCVVAGDALSVNVRVAWPRAPAAPGVNTALYVHVPPAGGTGVPATQVVPAPALKSPELVPVIAGPTLKLSAPVPLLVMVIGFAALATLTS